jgi:rhodanese-related sulfurtransferase
MNKRYIVPVIIILTLGVWFVFMPEVDNSGRELSPNEVLAAMNESSRFITTDEISNLLINNDPTFLLIDVRSEEEYSAYSLPGSINIPLANLLDEEWEGYLNQNAVNNVFFSNDEIKAETAWMICARKAYTNNYVLSGGVNLWFETIIEPVMPSVNSPKADWSLYENRVASSQYFTGSKVDAPAQVKPRKAVKIKPKKQRAEGGC